MGDSLGHSSGIHGVKPYINLLHTLRLSWGRQDANTHIKTGAKLWDETGNKIFFLTPRHGLPKKKKALQRKAKKWRGKGRNTARRQWKEVPPWKLRGLKKKKNQGWHILPSFRLLSISYASNHSYDFSICMKWLECSRAKTQWLV